MISGFFKKFIVITWDRPKHIDQILQNICHAAHQRRGMEGLVRGPATCEPIVRNFVFGRHFASSFLPRPAETARKGNS